jgi:hypothetical protein
MQKIPINISRLYSSYMPILLDLIEKTDGPILELGGGAFSTPLLHWMCAENKRKVVTYESRHMWYRFLSYPGHGFETKYHEVHYARNWDEIDIGGHWSVALVDHETHRRYQDARRLKDNADYIIIHDSHKKKYVLDRIWKEFKYIYHWDKYKIHTSVVSNKYEYKYQK